MTIVDDQKITREAIQNNFFLDPNSVGQSKAKSASELLQELNEDARVNFVEKVCIYFQGQHTSILIVISLYSAQTK